MLDIVNNRGIYSEVRRNVTVMGWMLADTMVSRFRKARVWWEQRRFRYNAGLVVAGALAFVCYVIVVDRGISTGAMPGGEITLSTTAFQAVGYMFMMILANACYFAGPLAETLVRPTKVERFRYITFQLGFWFSVLLPFSIPAAGTWLYLIHPSTIVTP